MPFFDNQLNFVFSKDIPGALTKLGVTEYSLGDWRLFTDSSKRNLKYVLLPITNVYGSILIGHSTTLKEKYDAIKSVLQHIKCNDHQWVISISGDVRDEQGERFDQDIKTMEEDTKEDGT